MISIFNFTIQPPSLFLTIEPNKDYHSRTLDIIAATIHLLIIAKLSQRQQDG